jgi:hypothetical protein
MKRVYLLSAFCIAVVAAFGRQAGIEFNGLLWRSHELASKAESEVTVTIDQPSPVVGCGAAVVLTATVTGTAELSWLRNGEYIDGATTAAFVANQSGMYTVIAVALTCQVQSLPVEVIIESPLNAAIVLPSGNEACAGQQVLLQATGGNADWQWYRNGSAIAGANGSSYVASESGNYTVVGNAASPCASTSAPAEIVVHPLPQVSIFWEGNSTICAGDSISLVAALAPLEIIEWYFNGAPFGEGTAAVSVSLSGQYSAMATNLTTGCTNSTNSLTLEVLPVQSVAIAAIGSASFCDGQSAVLELLTGSGTVQWQANGQDVEGATGSVLQVTSASSYTARVIDASGCASSSNELSIEVYPLPNTALSIEGNGAAVLCGEGDVLIAQAETDDSYVWYASGEEVVGEVGSAFEIDQPGEYAVQLTNAFGCVAVSEPLFVEEYALPELVLEPSGLVTLCAGQTQYFEAICPTAVQYEWYADGVLLDEEFNGYLEAFEPGAFTVRVFDENGCDVMSSPANVQVLVVDTPSIIDGGITDEGQLLVSQAASGNQWYFNGEPISGATQSTYVAGASGVYTVISIEDVCESALSEGFSVTISGIEEQDTRISLYPNPCNDYFVLEGLPSGGSAYTIYDMSGRIVLEGNTTGANHRVDTQGLDTGMYRLVLSGGGQAAFAVCRF